MSPIDRKWDFEKPDWPDRQAKDWHRLADDAAYQTYTGHPSERLWWTDRSSVARKNATLKEAKQSGRMQDFISIWNE